LPLSPLFTLIPAFSVGFPEVKLLFNVIILSAIFNSSALISVELPLIIKFPLILISSLKIKEEFIVCSSVVFLFK